MELCKSDSKASNSQLVQRHELFDSAMEMQSSYSIDKELTSFQNTVDLCVCNSKGLSDAEGEGEDGRAFFRRLKVTYLCHLCSGKPRLTFSRRAAAEGLRDLGLREVVDGVRAEL